MYNDRVILSSIDNFRWKSNISTRKADKSLNISISKTSIQIFENAWMWNPFFYLVLPSFCPQKPSIFLSSSPHLTSPHLKSGTFFLLLLWCWRFWALSNQSNSLSNVQCNVPITSTHSKYMSLSAEQMLNTMQVQYIPWTISTLTKLFSWMMPLELEYPKTHKSRSTMNRSPWTLGGSRKFEMYLSYINPR